MSNICYNILSNFLYKSHYQILTMTLEEFEAEQKKDPNYMVGPCCAFVAGKLSPTGLTWQEVAQRDENRIRGLFRTRGVDNPSLEMMYSKGHKYIRTKTSNNQEDLEWEGRIDMEFYIPKPSTKSKYKEVVVDKIYDIKNVDEQQFIIADEPPTTSFEFQETAGLDFISIDFETANSQRVSACSVGIVVVKNGLISERIYHYINPGDVVWGQINMKIHKITPEKVKDADSFPETWKKISHLFDNTLIIAHNASSFDMSVLRYCLDLHNIPAPDFKYGCTMQSAKSNGWDAKLKDLCKKFKIPLEHHNALSDAEACAMLAIKLHNDELFHTLNITSFY